MGVTVILVYFIYTAPSRLWPSSFCMVVDGSVVACIIDFYFCLLMTDGHHFRGEGEGGSIRCYPIRIRANVLKARATEAKGFVCIANWIGLLSGYMYVCTPPNLNGVA